MAPLLLVILLLWIVTAVHEAGHAAAVWLKGGRVEEFRVGRGPGPGWTAPGGVRLSLGLLPMGGRLDYTGVPRGTGTAVVALAGPLANVLLAVLLLPDREAVARWLWLVPGSVLEVVIRGQAPELAEGVRAMAGALDLGTPRPVMLALGSLSAIWAALNLVPVPPLRGRGGSDGWRLLASLTRLAVSGAGPRSEPGAGPRPGADLHPASSPEPNPHPKPENEKENL